MIDREQGWSILFFLRDQAQIGCMQAGTAAPCHSAVAVTSDAGRSWRAMLTSPLNPGGGSTIDHLQAVDAMHAWVLVTSACDTRGVCDKELRATADGGVTWRTERTGRIRQLRVASLARAWISVDAENGSVISATADGGASWHEQMVTTQPVISLDAASDRQAWVLTEDGSYCTASSCSRYELLFTGDGGTTWSSLSNPKDNVVAGPTCTTGHLSGPVFADAQIGWLGVSRGVGGGAGSSGIMRTKDGGRTWTCAVVPPDVERVSVADPRRILVLSRDARSAAYSPSLSVDGGASWTVLTLR